MTPPDPTVEAINSPNAPHDPLGEALHFLRMDGIFYSRSEFTAPWGIQLPTFPGCLMFHMVLEGRCLVEIQDCKSEWIEQGNLVLVPHGKGHKVLSESGTPTVKLFDLERELVSDRYEIIEHGNGGPKTSIICCTVRYEHPSAHQLIALLPPLIKIESANAPEQALIKNMIDLLGQEAQKLSSGSETILTRLADILLIQTIRTWIEQDTDIQVGWLGALRDEQLGKALSLIHSKPAHPWTVESLASEVAMSRAGFAARFKELIGESPMQYITRGRMHLALTYLKENKHPLIDLAERLGYQSEAAFSRAFKRFFGVSPGHIRRHGDWGFVAD